MRLGFDLDGVVYDFVGALADWHYHITGEDLPRRPVGWNFFHEWGWDGSTFSRVCRQATDAGFLFADGDPMPGAVQGVKTLVASGHEVIFVTARTCAQFGERCEDNTCEWLTKLGLPTSEVHFTHDKASIGMDMFLDDLPGNVARCLDAGIDAWLYDALGIWEPQPRRLTDWQQYIDIVDAAASA